MKKITFFLGLLLSLIGVSVEAQTITISDAPSGEEFADNTQWYLIKAANTDQYHQPGYLSNATDYVNSTAGFRLDNTTVPTTDDALWCLVGNETDGYTIYNKAAGTSKVLGFGSIAKMYDASTTESGVTIKFDYTSSTSSNYSTRGICVSLHGASVEEKYWNNANWNENDNTNPCKLGLWKGTSDHGNAFYFIPVKSIDEASTASNSFVLLADVPSTYTVLKTIVPSIESACETEYNTFNNNKTLGNANALVKAAINAVDGKAFRFQNGRTTDNVLYAMDGYALITPDTYLTTNVADLWKFKSNDNGEVLLYNVNTKSYIGALSTSYDSNAKSTAMTSNQNDAEGFTIASTNETPKYLIRNSKGRRICGDNSSKNYRINYWSANEEANRWTITEATSLEVALASVDGQTNTYASAYLPVSVSSVSGATAYLGSLSEDNSTLKMTAATAGVPAETGFVLVGESGATTATLTLGESTTSASDNSLTGTLSTITLGDDNPRASYLAFGVNSGTVGFYTPSSSVATIPANKAFIDATKLSASAIAMQFGNTPTGISNATIATAGAAAPVFDLSGRRVANPAKGGIYIQNGKKFVK